jgi:hypothetical protein
MEADNENNKCLVKFDPINEEWCSYKDIKRFYDDVTGDTKSQQRYFDIDDVRQQLVTKSVEK